MSSWPSPPNTSQKKAKLPGLSEVMVDRLSSPGTMSVLTPKSGILKPWMRSIDESTKVIGWLRFTFTTSGVKSNFMAMISTSFGVSAARRRAAPAALLPASSATKYLRFMALGPW